MKTKQGVILIAFATLTLGVTGQTTKPKPQKDSVAQNQDNFMDMAAKTFTGIFGNSLDGNPNGLTEGIGFLELLEKTEFPEQEKEEYRKMYRAQSQDLTKAQRDSLEGFFFQKILEKEQTKKQ